MSVQGNFATLAQFSAALRNMPKVLAQKVATAAADEITSLGLGTFDASKDAYGAPWAPGFDGKRVDLKETGRLSRYIRYVAIGTKLRSVLGVPYAKYQVGRRPVYPRGRLPLGYVRALSRIAEEVARQELGQ